MQQPRAKQDEPMYSTRTASVSPPRGVSCGSDLRSIGSISQYRPDLCFQRSFRSLYYEARVVASYKALFSVRNIIFINFI